MTYALIGQNLTGEFMPKIYEASGNLFTLIAEADRVLCCCLVKLSFSTGCTNCNTTAIKILLLFMAGLFIGFLVEKCATCQSHQESNLTWRRFGFLPCLMRKRVEKSQAIMAFRSCISSGKLE